MLMDEYRVLYGLATFRMTTLDRRVLLAWAALGAFLVSFVTVGAVGQRALLIALPLALVWLTRTTIGHARSFEDVLRRIDEIERAVNHIAGEELVTFQSRHPSRQKAVGGRTGTETVRTIYATALVMLTVATHLHAQIPGSELAIKTAYAAFCIAATAHILLDTLAFARYRYDKLQDSGRPPLIWPS